MKDKERMPPISFDLSPDQAKALATLAGGRGVRLAGIVTGDKVVIDFIALNNGVVKISETPFDVPGMAPFIACNGPMPDVVG
ncbi:hypothetical protein [Lysobacter sp. CA196]|uniref:hypothetical protein n=1 Tax=Lysobacter sp. CA196 TaxID=3455606 RepID=UPI003F8CF6E3